jgi:hypothetical protein
MTILVIIETIVLSYGRFRGYGAAKADTENGCNFDDRISSRYHDESTALSIFHILDIQRSFPSTWASFRADPNLLQSSNSDFLLVCRFGMTQLGLV